MTGRGAMASLGALKRPENSHALTVAGQLACALGVVIAYPLFFAAANAAFARGILADSEVTVLLGRWSRWPWAALYTTTIQYRVAAR